MTTRYAIYFVPEADTALAALGSTLLGRESETGKAIPQPDFPGLSTKTLHAMTVDARRYGLHATLKAPFFLKPGMTERELLRFADDFVMGRPPIALPKLMLKRISSFFALTPSGETPEERDALQSLNTLAADAVTLFDPFRAAPTEKEIARRNPQELTERQRALLAEWGYPYVHEEFRFHLTLTDQLRDATTARILEEALQATLANVCKEGITVSGICVCKQTLPDPAPEPTPQSSNHDDAFILLQRIPFQIAPR